jgi:SAM-dependent methyltransferase
VTLPRVSDAELGAFYPDEYGPYDDRMSGAVRLVSRAIRSFQGWNAMRTAPLDAVKERPGGRGLDVGCGRGDLAALLASRGWDMDGIDPSPAACAAAAGRGIGTRCGTATTVELEPGVYGLTVFRHSLEHTNDPVASLRAVAAALVPGGLVLISVPNFASRQSRAFRDCWFHLDLPRHRVHFTPAALRTALGAAGLESLSMSLSASSMGLPASLQYRAVGRCLFPERLSLRVAVGLCAVTIPAAHLYDRGEADTLHAVARRPLSG